MRVFLTGGYIKVVKLLAEFTQMGITRCAIGVFDRWPITMDVGKTQDLKMVCLNKAIDTATSAARQACKEKGLADINQQAR